MESEIEVYSLVMEDLHPHPIHGGGSYCRLFSTKEKAIKCACEWIKEYIENMDEDMIEVYYESGDLDEVLALIAKENYTLAYDKYSGFADYDACPQVHKERVI